MVYIFAQEDTHIHRGTHKKPPYIPYIRQKLSIDADFDVRVNVRVPPYIPLTYPLHTPYIPLTIAVNPVLIWCPVAPVRCRLACVSM